MDTARCVRRTSGRTSTVMSSCATSIAGQSVEYMSLGGDSTLDSDLESYDRGYNIDCESSRR